MMLIIQTRTNKKLSILNLIVIKIIVHTTLFILITSAYKNPNTNPLEDPIIHSSRFTTFINGLPPIPSKPCPKWPKQNQSGGGHGALSSTRPSQPAPPPLSSYHGLQHPSPLCLHCHSQPPSHASSPWLGTKFSFRQYLFP